MSDFAKRGLSFYLNIAVVLFAVISTFSYIAYTSAGGSAKYGIYFVAVAAVVTGCVSLLVQNKYSDLILLLGSGFLSAGFALFVTSDDVILTFVDYIFKINYWGNTELIPNIITTAVLFLVASALAILGCFVARTNKPDITGGQA
ncbi:MAG: hypothetical protein LBT59_15080 [Clostridiales bacterium]|jgi:uncharacterized membrane protein YjjP (DUF1212 family)|nr:hypothetical protein [Clostridiales bacterium]